MRPSVLRVIFAALLLATVASQIQAFHAPRTDPLAKLADVLKDQGLSPSNPSAGLGYGRSMEVMVPGCDLPLRVAPMRLSLEEAPLLEASLLPGDVSRYVFVGQAWRRAEPRSLRWQWFKHKLGSLIGFPVRRLDTVLFVAIPGNCPAAERIDWLPLWSS